jgi:protein gp37
VSEREESGEICDQTINFFVGCTRVSEGCQRCYAERMASQSFHAHHRAAVTGTRWNGRILAGPESVWERPRARRRPTTYFVGSMTDWLHPAVPLPLLARMFALFADTQRHTYELLTKRPERLADTLRALGLERLPDNVWSGVTVESARWKERLEPMRAAPAGLRFVVCEPLLGPLGELDLRGFDWVISGGESGVGARRCDPDWVRELRDRCVAAGVAFHHKSWGSPRNNPLAARYPAEKQEGETLAAFIARVDPDPGAKGGAWLDGRLWHQVPVRPSEVRCRSRGA